MWRNNYSVIQKKSFRERKFFLELEIFLSVDRRISKNYVWSTLVAAGHHAQSPKPVVFLLF